ncbi:MAG: helix-turn-helix domain-containing protein [Silvanigrellaceae bacterium]|nr:helix-turn-helix domain-containing protein [Silvanigrellaceae bacterium]
MSDFENAPLKKNHLGVNSQAAKAIGERLRKERELKGKSVHEISLHIKIREIYIHAIENGDWESLPSGLNGRGLIRLYAKELKVALPELDDFGKGQFASSSGEHQGESHYSKLEKHPDSNQPSEVVTPDIYDVLGLPQGENQKNQTAKTTPSHQAESFSNSTNTFDPPSSEAMLDKISHILQIFKKLKVNIIPYVAIILVIPIIVYVNRDDLFSESSEVKNAKELIEMQSEEDADVAATEHIHESLEPQVTREAPVIQENKETKPSQVVMQQPESVKQQPEIAKQQPEIVKQQPTPPAHVQPIPPAHVQPIPPAHVQPTPPAHVQEVKHQAPLTQQEEKKQEEISSAQEVTSGAIAKLAVLEDVELQVTADGVLVFSGTRPPGELNIKFLKKAEIYIGDGSKVKLFYDGWDHGVLGYNGRKRKIILNAQGYQQ